MNVKMEAKIQYGIIKTAIHILALQCSADENKVIDLLTGYLWSEEDAGQIKSDDGKGWLEPLTPQFMAICSVCGNKRCPHSTDSNKRCTGSNDAGQTTEQ